MRSCWRRWIATDYKKATLMRQPTVVPFIHIVNAERVTINGGGLIDGRGQVWWDYVKGVKDSGVLGTDHPRPMGMLIDHSNHVTVEDIVLQNAGFWQIVPYYSNYLTFHHLKVLAPQRGAPNTDGIDPFSSSHITIDHVLVERGGRQYCDQERARSTRPARMRRARILRLRTAL